MTTGDQDGGADPATAYRAHLTDALEAAQRENDPRLYLKACATLHLVDGTGPVEPRAASAALVSTAMAAFYDIRRAEGDSPQAAVMGAAYETLSAALVAALSCQTLLGAANFAQVWNRFAGQLMEGDGAPH